MNHQPSDPFEQALHRALGRVQPPASLAESLLRQTKTAHPQTSPSNLLQFPRAITWAAAAATLAAGLVLTHQHQQHAAQRAQAEREFALTERITDQAFAQIREQLKNSGVQLDQQ